MQVGYNAIALDAKGHGIPDKIWGWEMPVLADFNPRAFNPKTVRHDGEPVDALADARKWAAKISIPTGWWQLLAWPQRPRVEWSCTARRRRRQRRPRSASRSTDSAARTG